MGAAPSLPQAQDPSSLSRTTLEPVKTEEKVPSPPETALERENNFSPEDRERKEDPVKAEEKLPSPPEGDLERENLSPEDRERKESPSRLPQDPSSLSRTTPEPVKAEAKLPSAAERALERENLSPEDRERKENPSRLPQEPSSLSRTTPEPIKAEEQLPSPPERALERENNISPEDRKRKENPSRLPQDPSLSRTTPEAVKAEEKLPSPPETDLERENLSPADRERKENPDSEDKKTTESHQKEEEEGEASERGERKPAPFSEGQIISSRERRGVEREGGSKMAISTIARGSSADQQSNNLQKEMREGISRLAQSLAVKNPKLVDDNGGGRDGITMITLAGDNRGATMTVEGERSSGMREKDGSMAAIATSLNSNVQAINGSILHDSCCRDEHPGVHLVVCNGSRMECGEEREMGKVGAPLMAAREPRVRRRCLRALMMEDGEEKESPRRRHGCRYVCNDGNG